LNEGTDRKKSFSFPSELDLVRRAFSILFCTKLLHPFGEREEGFTFYLLLFHHHPSSFWKPVFALEVEKRGTHRDTDREPESGEPTDFTLWGGNSVIP
jgi:hypothetical protein